MGNDPCRRLPAGHIYVDESTAGDYLLMCTAVPVGSISQTRAAMRRLLLPRQRRLHMSKEVKRAPAILAVIAELRPDVVIYRVHRATPELEARRACLHALAMRACRQGVDRIVLDQIDSMVKRDSAWLLEGIHLAGHGQPPLTYHHQRGHEEPLLWIPDAVGWAWARGGAFRDRVAPLVTIEDL
jgi:hypothetical protein